MNGKKVVSIAAVGVICFMIIAGVVNCIVKVVDGIVDVIDSVVSHCCPTVERLVEDILDAD